MNKPDFRGWIDTVPDLRVDLPKILKEYRTHVEPLMQEVDREGTPPCQRRHILKDSSMMPETDRIIQELAKTLNFTDVIYRSILPGTAYFWHRDDAEVCYHIPLTTNPGSWFVYEHRSFQMPADGSIYIVNNGRWHTFVNSGYTERVHITFMDYSSGKYVIGY